jgi:hypothetical protein
MTGTTERPPRTPTTREEPEPQVSGWTGWVFFAGIMLIIVGVLQAIQGVVALFNDEYYLVRPSGLVVQLDYTAWGWTHLILGVAAIIVGAGLFSGNTAARVGAVIVVSLSAIANMAFIAAYPWWSLIVIAIDILVIYAVLVHGRELRSPAT